MHMGTRAPKRPEETCQLTLTGAQRTSKVEGSFLLDCADPCKCEKPYMQVFLIRNVPQRWRTGRAARRREGHSPTRL